MFNQISTGDMTWDMLEGLIFYDLGGFFYGRTVQNCNSSVLFFLEKKEAVVDENMDAGIDCSDSNTGPAEHGYAPPLQTVYIQIKLASKKPTGLDLHCLSLSMWICINNLAQAIWLAEN